MVLECINSAVDFVWGPFLLIPLLLLAGAFFMVRIRFLPFRRLRYAFALMWKGRKHSDEHEGELSPFNALMTSMAATVGTGNIVGVASAIMVGGPGAVFWMWMTALVGMATKYCEALLAVKYREVTPDGSYVGGPMYYIRKGLGENWAWLAFLFAVFGAVASFGIGNMTQANSITDSVSEVVSSLIASGSGVTPESFAATKEMVSLVTAGVLFLTCGAVLVGGVRRIGMVAGMLVPFMALFYICVGIVALVWNVDKVPAAVAMIFTEAFSVTSAAGGAFGVAIIVTIQSGVARGLFSNEAGLGSAPIAHATAITDSPVRQGFLGMLDPFLDTIVICSITALVILVTNHWYYVDPVTGRTLLDPITGKAILGSIPFEKLSPELLASLSPESLQALKAQGPLSKALLTQRAFGTAIPGGIGTYVVAIGQILFAFSTILGWCVYGERCTIYLLGHRAAKAFRILFTVVVPFGALARLDLVWALADLFNGLMALPNLVALLLLSPVVVRMTGEYFKDPANKL